MTHALSPTVANKSSNWNSAVRQNANPFSQNPLGQIGEGIHRIIEREKMQFKLSDGFCAGHSYASKDKKEHEIPFIESFSIFSDIP